MKILFPLLDESFLAPDFSKSNMLGIYDESNKSVQIIHLAIQTSHNQTATVFHTILQQNVDYVVSPVFSAMSLRVFKENNITPYKAVGKSIVFNINMLVNNQLQPYNMHDTGNHTSCSSSCSSCGVGCKS